LRPASDRRITKFEGEIEPHRHREAHAHDFDVRILVLDGSATLVLGATIQDY
jgi:hypothetical protein